MIVKFNAMKCLRHNKTWDLKMCLSFLHQFIIKGFVKATVWGLHKEFSIYELLITHELSIVTVLAFLWIRDPSTWLWWHKELRRRQIWMLLLQLQSQSPQHLQRFRVQWLESSGLKIPWMTQWLRQYQVLFWSVPTDLPLFELALQSRWDQTGLWIK